MKLTFKVNIKTNVYCIVLLFFCQTNSGCKRFLEVSPPVTNINGANVYNNDATAAAVMTGIYTNMSNDNFPGSELPSITFYAGLSSDELDLHSSAMSNVKYLQYYTNALTSQVSPGTDFWASGYRNIFIANSVVEGVSTSKTLTQSVRRGLLGEAKFIRAFCYFYLVNLYGDVPLTTSTDYKLNSLLSRTSKAQVYQQIISDLSEAKELLSDTYVKGDLQGATQERTRPNKWAASALLARVYLFVHDYEKAEQQATSVIDNVSLYHLEDLKNVFNKTSTEAIWQLQPVRAGQNTADAQLFVIPSTGLSIGYPVSLSSSLLDSFEVGDHRQIMWIGKYTDTSVSPNIDYYYPYKYKVDGFNTDLFEYTVVLRLAEQYLIRAESRAHQNKIDEAVADLNIIRSRASLAEVKSKNKDTVLSAILHERQIELFLEWGHRWLDIKRTALVNIVMANVVPKKGGNWNSHFQWYPIQSVEIQTNRNLVQNAGY